MRLARALLALTVSASLLSACASTTVIRTNAPEAKLYIDGEYRGRGTITHTDQKVIGSSTSVRIQQEGCEPQMESFARNEEFDPGACAGGVFVLVPFLWVMKYKPEHSYEYQCRPMAQPPVPLAPPQQQPQPAPAQPTPAPQAG